MDGAESRLEMPGVHAIMLLSAAPGVAEMFRTDPRVAALVNPAVYIAADVNGVIASVIERLQITELISGPVSADWTQILGETPEDAPIVVLVSDESGMAVYRVPDPRNDRELWPWMGLDVEEG
jgi:hypothetical protein